jgi:hypothetical protein
LLRRVVEHLRAEHAGAERVARETADAANHPEARPENDKDTRKIELSYLAAGQASRAAELGAAVAALGAFTVRAFAAGEPIEAGALVSLEIDGAPQTVFLAPAGGGSKIGIAGREVSVVTPVAPLGRELLGKTAGDSFDLTVAGRLREVHVVGVV